MPWTFPTHYSKVKHRHSKYPIYQSLVPFTCTHFNFISRIFFTAALSNWASLFSPDASETQFIWSTNCKHKLPQVSTARGFTANNFKSAQTKHCDYIHVIHLSVCTIVEELVDDSGPNANARPGDDGDLASPALHLQVSGAPRSRPAFI